jgi:opacity protein-like surface antigen
LPLGLVLLSVAVPAALAVVLRPAVRQPAAVVAVLFPAAAVLVAEDGGLLPTPVAGLLLALLAARPLSALALGDTVARGLGHRPARARGVAMASVALLVGGARGATIKTRLGHFHDRDLLVTSVRASWPVGGEGANLRYTVDLVPLVIATGNRFYAATPDSGCAPGQPCAYGGPLVPERRTAYAAGLAPLGAELRFRPGRRVELSAAAGGGFLLFNIPVPDQGETRFNWTFDLGAGVHVAVSSHLRVAAGYRLSHISNGGRGPVNPGMDTHLLVLGVERTR